MTETSGSGIFIAFEGIDGTGKSSQIQLLSDALQKKGHKVICTREPTDGEYGRQIRELYIKRDRVSKEEELELFLADRREHVTQVIEPALRSGKVVLTDRYYFSTAAYQGANGMDPADILKRNEAFAPCPDLVLLIDLPVSESLHRITKNRGDTPNTFEQEEYLHRVKVVYDQMDNPCIQRIDGMGSVNEIHNRVMTAVHGLLA